MVTQAIVFISEIIRVYPWLNTVLVTTKGLNDRNGLADDKGKNYTKQVGHKT